MGLTRRTMKRLMIFSIALSAPLSTGYTAVDDTRTHKIRQFVKIQLNNNNGVEPVIRNLLTRYPSYTSNTIEFFATNYPNHYQQMFNAIASTNSAFLPDALLLFLSANEEDKYLIISAAIKAEPSYADILVETLLDHYPENAYAIVETAVVTEPQSADQIIRTASGKFPDKVIGFLRVAFTHIPFVGPYIVESLVALAPERSFELLKESMSYVTNDKINYDKLINCAKSAGLSDNELDELAKLSK